MTPWSPTPPTPTPTPTRAEPAAPARPAFPGVELLCSDLLDDDLDGLYDCLDPDCIADSACAVTCPETNGTVSQIPTIIRPSTLGLGDEYGDTVCGGVGASDLTYEFRAPSDGVFIFDTDGSSFDTVLRIWDDCLGSEQDCDDQPFPTGERLSVPMTTGETVLVVIDGAAPTESGDVTLTIDKMTEGDCTDVVDDDFDGDTDCDDRDCATDPACALVCVDDTVPMPCPRP